MMKMIAFSKRGTIIYSERVLRPMRIFERRMMTMAVIFGIFGALYLAGMIAMTVRGLNN